MEKVKKLTEETINKIAAGEVIDRPASVVKELVENSLDAGATRVSITFEDSGLSVLEVKDNGMGMEPRDLQLALQRHTTSKITSLEDLLSIRSFGFRGEALASIASVSKVEIASIPMGMNQGVEIIAAGGKVIDENPCTGENGTVVRVKELFFNTPARKKFLRGRKAEHANLCQAYWDLAIPSAGVGFSLTGDGTEMPSLAADLSIYDRVRVREGEMANVLEDFEEVSPYFTMKGFVSSPVKTFPRTNRIYLFVNRRAVKDSLCVAAIKDGMRGLIPENRFPCAYVFIEVSPEEADFNVHPAKREVRFRYRKELFELMRYAVRNRFVRSSPGGISFRGSNRETDYRLEKDGFGVEKIDVETGGTSHSAAEEGYPLMDQQGGREQDSLFEVPKSFSDMRIVGQVLGNYLLIEGGEELFVLDIHAASERVEYWRVQEGFRNWLESPEHLLISVPIPVERLRGHRDHIAELLSDVGYIVEHSEEFVKINALPVYLKGIDPLSVIDDLIELIESGSLDVTTEPEGVLEDLLARMACHASLRGPHRFHDDELTLLLKELDGVQYNRTCPHGRPVFIKITRQNLHKLFGRT